MDDSKIIFTFHIDEIGHLNEAKERFDCPHCNGECFIKEESVYPKGTQSFKFECTDCHHTWEEIY